MGFTQTCVLCALSSLYIQTHWAISPFHAKSLHKILFFPASLEIPASPADQTTALPRKGKYSNLLKVLPPTQICLYLYNSFQFSVSYVSTSEKKKKVRKRPMCKKEWKNRFKVQIYVNLVFTGKSSENQVDKSQGIKTLDLDGS